MGKIGLQLYSVREAASRDFLGTIQKVADMGYQAVQFAGFFDTPADRLKQVLDEKGTLCAGAHIALDQLVGDRLQRTLDYNDKIGNDLLICPALPSEFRQTIDGYKRAAELLNEAGEACRRAGFTLGYHNHDFEFQEIDGRIGFDVLFEHTDPQLVKVELDCFWAAYAGFDPLQIIETYQDRCVSLHLKDLKRVNDKKVDTEVGTGELDVVGLLQLGIRYGVKWFVVEQEDFTIDPLQSVAISARNLKHLFDRAGV